MNPVVTPLTHTTASPPRPDRQVLWLQCITLAWMSVECVVSLVAARRAHSSVLLAFGSDSLVELLSATVVLLQFTPRFRIDRERAAQLSGVMLYILAAAVGLIALASAFTGVKSGESPLGIAISVGALIVMPVLAWLKRSKAAATGDRALAADAMQSATCAWLAAITLLALGVRALIRVNWLDPAAALCAIPILIVEAKRAGRGESCACC